ncbi:prolipoprotein diacylglyceryl transferase family protein [Cohnella massiliensis]|uniref:prolipoprotein diacylglyceryl transferase family protein n=1 Tax=Cohnella massiliensis TaxID=1816691 RepID=UPI0009BC6C5A|nr:prolipoprotein diacylglyceryl transferase family protein [Cohnella massiliensis]
MTGVLQIGPFVIRADWFYYGVSALIGFSIARMVVRKKSLHALQHLDIIFNALLIGILIWKVSPLFSEPQLLTNPFSLLFYPGTTLGSRIAFAGAMMYLLHRWWRSKADWREASDVLSIVLISSVMIYLVTHWQYGLRTMLPWGISISDPEYRYHPVNAYQLLLLLPLLWHIIKLSIGQGKMASHGFIGYGIISLFVSLLKPKSSIWLNLTMDQWIAIVVIIIGFIMMTIKVPERETRSESNGESGEFNES